MKKVILCFVATLATMSASAQANSKNPLDQIGKIHNDLVQQFIDQNGSTTLPTAMVASEMKKLASQHPQLKKYRFSNSYPFDLQIIEKGRSDFKNNFRNVIAALSTSSVVKTELQRLIDYHFKIAFESKKTSYNDYYNHIVEFENSILSNNSIISPDKNIILAGTAIARYSVHMWERTYSGGGSGLGFWNYVLVGVCDVVGGVAGFVASEGNWDTTVQYASSTSTVAHNEIKGKRN